MNPQSQATIFNYFPYVPAASPVVRLQSITDGDGLTNTISYNGTNAYSTNLISQVVDPFGRTCSLAYDTNGHLTSITDVAGLISSFTYGSNDWVSSLTTPYGTTSFAITDTSGAQIVPNGRSVLVTQPDGGSQLYLYKDSAPGIAWAFDTNSLPSTAPFANTFEHNEMNFRNTFHWGPKQYANLSTTNISAMTAADFTKARLRHWLKWDYFTVGETLSMEREPSPDNAGSIEGQRTWYDYTGKIFTTQNGTQVLPLFTARVTPDGTPQFTRTDRNSFGAGTVNIGTYWSNGVLAFRTNVTAYNPNDIDHIAMTNALKGVSPAQMNARA